MDLGPSGFDSAPRISTQPDAVTAAMGISP